MATPTAPPAAALIRPAAGPFALLASVFVIASCGLIYELLAGTLATYILGDSVTQFSLVIGVYMSALGAGSWLSRYVAGSSAILAARFVDIELLVALVGGVSAGALFVTFALAGDAFIVALYGFVLAIGMLVGLEVPLVMRLLRERLGFRDLVASVLSFDYVGALAASIAFPLLLVPHLGLIRTACLFGLMNAGVAAWALWLFRGEIGALGARAGQCALVVAVLLAGFIGADRLTRFAETRIYADEIVFAANTRHQRIVLTRWREDVRLYLNGNLQFSSADEYRYHESLVHPALASVPWARNVLVLGGGDGLAVRELLKYPQVQRITLVDLDPEMTRLFTTLPLARRLNGDALQSPKVTVVNADAFKWLEDSVDGFDVAIVDFPDPSNYALARLYSGAFYRMLERRLNARGVAAVQATSPLYARQSYWTIVSTIESAGFTATPYHALVPSFGEWGFVIASRGAWTPPARYDVPLRFLATELHPALFTFPQDMARVAMPPNQLHDPGLVRTFEMEWRRAGRN
jgi:spermidine synthase